MKLAKVVPYKQGRPRIPLSKKQHSKGSMPAIKKLKPLPQELQSLPVAEMQREQTSVPTEDMYPSEQQLPSFQNHAFQRMLLKSGKKKTLSYINLNHDQMKVQPMTVPERVSGEAKSIEQAA